MEILVMGGIYRPVYKVKPPPPIADVKPDPPKKPLVQQYADIQSAEEKIGKNINIMA